MASNKLPKGIKDYANKKYSEALEKGASQIEANQVYKDIIQAYKDNPNATIPGSEKPTGQKPVEKQESDSDSSEKSSDEVQDDISNQIDIDVPKDILDSEKTEMKNPFQGETTKRPYAAPPIDNNIATPIAEPDTSEVVALEEDEPINPQSTSGGELNIGNDNKTEPKKDFTSEIRNPDLDNLEAKEKRRAAKELATIAVDAYVWLNVAVKKKLQYSELDLLKMQQKGKINLEILKRKILCDDEESTQTVEEFIDAYNKGLDELYVVEEEWKEKVISLLVEIFIKKGWGLTEENSLLFYIGKDVINKTYQSIMMRNAVSDLIKQVSEQTKIMKQQLEESKKANMKQSEASKVEVVKESSLNDFQESRIEDANIVSESTISDDASQLKD